ncbi:MAG TPA: HAMP domain-containing protein, partial [Gammaproteobacteria bacterium]|nr:HAMP domain-containing protein [Gammaproteobacteria bacterium]
MRVRWWHSLRLRIAGVILLLEALLLGVVLWATLDHDREKARQLIREQDRVVLELLAQDARQALLTLEFDTLGDLFRRAASNPRILRILLLDRRGMVVASDDRRLLGRRRQALPPPPPDSYRRRISIEDLAGSRGTLEVRFSTRRLQQIYRESWRLGLTLGLAGILLSMLAALAVGHLLTRRLTRLTRYAESVAGGRPAEPVRLGGQDEVSALARAIDTMVVSLHDQTSRMRRMAYRDPLTGLANRVAFRERLEKALASARRYHSR